MFSSHNLIYYGTIALQIFCIVHCIRNKRQYYWIFAIIFLPVIGSLIYFFTEIIDKGGFRQGQTGMQNLFNPAGSVKKLEENLRFADTFQNRTALAHSYLMNGNTQEAIRLYEAALTGNFTENEEVLSHLLIAYYQAGRYDDVITAGKKIEHLPQFPRSAAHIMYAKALSIAGNTELAEKQFLSMKGRYSNFEARYEYGRFLESQNRMEEARNLYTEIMEEANHLSTPEKRSNSRWIGLVKEAMKKL